MSLARIVSQNEKFDLNYNNYDLFIDIDHYKVSDDLYETTEVYSINAKSSINKENTIILGIYETEERAIEVLKKLHMFFISSPYNFYFEMPKK